MVCPTGFEPVTPSLEGLCSIQLSYGHKMVGNVGVEPTVSVSLSTPPVNRLRDWCFAQIRDGALPLSYSPGEFKLNPKVLDGEYYRGGL